MISMEPVLRHGHTFWERALFPPDEFAERLGAVKEQMRRDNLDALIISSDAYHPSADLAWLAGWPMGGALLVTRDGEPAMFTSDNGRGLYFQRWLTWIDETSAAGGRMAPALLEALKRRGIASGAVGLVGEQSASAYATMRGILSDYQLRAFDAAMARLRMRKRPRELLAIGAALRIATDAAAAAQRAYNEGGSNASALVAAERAARLDRARDFRGLANLSGMDLRPYEGPSSARQNSLLLWAAVDYHGYWADVALTSPPSPGGRAQRALDAMVRAARPGATGDDLAQAALQMTPPESAELALSYGLGGGIGLSLEEAPFIRPKSTDVLAEDMVLSLRVLVRENEQTSFAGVLVEVGTDGAKRLDLR